MDKKSAMQSHPISASKLSAKYIALEEGFRQFSSDLNKLQVGSIVRNGSYGSAK